MQLSSACSRPSRPSSEPAAMNKPRREATACSIRGRDGRMPTRPRRPPDHVAIATSSSRRSTRLRYVMREAIVPASAASPRQPRPRRLRAGGELDGVACAALRYTPCRDHVAADQRSCGVGPSSRGSQVWSRDLSGLGRRRHQQQHATGDEGRRCAGVGRRRSFCGGDLFRRSSVPVCLQMK